jgi:hypothetical protein
MKPNPTQKSRIAKKRIFKRFHRGVVIDHILARVKTPADEQKVRNDSKLTNNPDQNLRQLKELFYNVTD